MKAISARVTRGLNLGSLVNAADNSGARIVKIVSVFGGKGTKGRQFSARVGDKVKVSIKKGDPDMRKKVFDAIVIRQKKEYRRLTGERISFEDNAVVILKDDKTAKGTQIKGPIAKEVSERWPSVARIASTAV